LKKVFRKIAGQAQNIKGSALYLMVYMSQKQAGKGRDKAGQAGRRVVCVSMEIGGQI
jgi:hypothetical protein